MHAESLSSTRFRGDIDLLDAMQRDPVIRRQLQRTESLRRFSKVRARLLGNAVRVDVRLVPNVAASFERLRSVIGGDKPLEAYVFGGPSVAAFVTEASSRYIVAVSSGAINLLDAGELDFVIGHELGHAAFGHLSIVGEAVLELGDLGGEQRRLVRAWQRASEISADRVGLLCCDSLEVAATALFKCLSGLDLPGLSIDPDDFSAQWEGLVQEIMDQGGRESWQLSHPFPPLRMKALALYWRGRGTDRADEETGRLLAHMDAITGPAAAQGDPLLSRFDFWGGLYVALADSAADEQTLRRFQPVAPPGVDIDRLLVTDGGLPDLCLSQFRAARDGRRSRLSARELHRIATGLVDSAVRGGRVSDRGAAHLHRLGQELGLNAEAMNLLIGKRLDKER